jgi:hypothetical protein
MFETDDNYFAPPSPQETGADTHGSVVLKHNWQPQYGLYTRITPVRFR